MKTILPLLLLLVLSTNCGAPDPPLTLSQGSVNDDFHRSQIGKIHFMADWIAYDKFGADDFISTVDLSETTELNFRMYLDKTITAHLADLAPGLSVRELCDAGSFQLNFIVDGKLLYEYNLQTGAGSCDYKNETTVYGVPLRGEKEIDHWGRFLWVKFMKLGGGEAALAEGIHELKIEVRPYVDLGEVKTGPLIAAGNIRLSNKLREVTATEVAVQPISPTPRFSLAEAKPVPELIEAMNRKIALGQYEDVTSIVVLKEGKLLLEEYFNGADRATQHDTRSVGKSFAGTIAGIALKEGHLKSVAQPLTDYYQLDDFANPSTAKATTTIRQLLTMTTGFDGNDDAPASPGWEENMYPTKDWVRFTLDLPARADTGWSYFTAGVVLLGDILHQSVPGGLEAYAAEKLFTPLGIEDQRWQRTPTGVGNTAGGLAMSSLSLATYGQLYLDGGRDILPEGWAETSLSPLVARNDDKEGHYGYFFWHDTLEVNGTAYTTAYASGNGGNKVVVIPELELVVVITATAYGKPYAHRQAEEMLADYLVPAVLATAL